MTSSKAWGLLRFRFGITADRTVIVDSDSRFDKLCGSQLQSQNEIFVTPWTKSYGITFK